MYLNIFLCSVPREFWIHALLNLSEYLSYDSDGKVFKIILEELSD